MAKILIVVFRPDISEDMMSLIIKIIKCSPTHTVILSPIDLHSIKKTASNEGAKVDAIKERFINEAYVNLYHLEDTFKKQALDVTISTKEMRMPEDLISTIKKINPDMLFVVGTIETPVLESLRDALSVPILLLPTEEK